MNRQGKNPVNSLKRMFTEAIMEKNKADVFKKKENLLEYDEFMMVVAGFVL